MFKSIMWEKIFSKKILSVIISVLFLYTLVLSTINYFPKPKIGYLNSALLVEKYSGAQKAKAELDKKTSEWKKNIQTLEEELNNLNKEMLANGSKWTKQQMVDKQKIMKSKQEDYNRYLRAITDKAKQTENELLTPVYNEINSKIENYGKDKGYDLILGTLSGGNILYGNKAVDLTDDFLEYTKKK